mgnify:CR=1 FL=1
MHRQRYLALSSVFVLLAFVCQGCLEIETTSRVNTDGTILRTVVFKGDSSAIFGGNFPLPLDSTWHGDLQKAEEKKFVLTTTRLFRDVQELNTALQGTKAKTLGVRVNLQRQFRWFYTTYQYRETWLSFNPFRAVPITDYLSPGELDYFIRHEMKKEAYPTKGDSLALKDASQRFEKWDDRNMFTVYFEAFLEGVKRLHDPFLTPTYVDGLKDSLFEESKKYFRAKNMDTVTVIFGRILKTRNVRKAMASNAEGFQRFDAERGFLEKTIQNSYRTNVIMPGLVTGTNAPTLEGNKASWEDYIKFAYFGDIDLWVESKVTNWWAITVTGIVAVVLLALSLLAVLRRQRS